MATVVRLDSDMQDDDLALSDDDIAAIDEGLADIDAGRVVSAEEVFAELRQRLRAR